MSGVLSDNVGRAGGLVKAAGGGGKVAQGVTASTDTFITTTTAIPGDNTLPQNSEGVEIVTLAITPTNASSTLIIWVHAPEIANTTANQYKSLALFKDSDADAIFACTEYSNDTAMKNMSFVHSQSAGSTSEQTFKLRGGNGNLGTFQINLSGQFGTIDRTSITIMEVLP